MTTSTFGSTSWDASTPVGSSTFGEITGDIEEGLNVIYVPWPPWPQWDPWVQWDTWPTWPTWEPWPQWEPWVPWTNGTNGTNAPNTLFEYSIDGSTSWHSTYVVADKYIRSSVDGGATWSTWMKFIGDNGTGTWDVNWPASSTDNAIARFDWTTGKLIQNSGATIDDSGNITAANLSWTNTGDQTSIVWITWTIAQFNAACTDADFATWGGTATGTNTGDQTSIVGISGTKAQFDTACTDWDFAYQSNLSSYVPTSRTLTINWTTLDLSANRSWTISSAPKEFRITIPWELVADTSNYQWMYFKNTSGASWTISNVAIAVGKAAAGTWAAAAVNLYKSSGTNSDGINTSAVNLFTSAIDLWTGYTSLTNVPNTTTVEDWRWLSLRVTSSAGATNKASDLQVIITLA